MLRRSRLSNQDMENDPDYEALDDKDHMQVLVTLILFLFDKIKSRTIRKNRCS